MGKKLSLVGGIFILSYYIGIHTKKLAELAFKHVLKPIGREISAAVADALAKWEKLDRVKITEVNEGKVTLSLEGKYLPKGKNVSFDNITICLKKFIDWILSILF